jgi:hypothetical protein
MTAVETRYLENSTICELAEAQAGFSEGSLRTKTISPERFVCEFGMPDYSCGEGYVVCQLMTGPKNTGYRCPLYDSMTRSIRELWEIEEREKTSGRRSRRGMILDGVSPGASWKTA